MAGEKTEKPTEHKLSEARKKGDVPRSKELGTLMTLASLLIVGGYGLGIIVNTLTELFIAATDFRSSLYSLDLVRGLSLELLGQVIILGLAITLHTYLGGVMLGKPIFTLDKLQPKAENLSWAKGIKKIISKQNLFEAVKSLAKLALIASILGSFLSNRFFHYASADQGSRDSLIGMINENVYYVISLIVLIMLVFSLIDVPFQIATFMKKMKMSMQDIKDEHKKMEGNPDIKGKIKQKQREMRDKKSISRTADASFVLVNPTHYSVALKYDLEEQSAPVLVSKGTDMNALKIREIATQEMIPVISIPQLARAIYGETEVGSPIPPILYSAVAELIHYLLKLDDVMAHDASELSKKIVVPDKYM